MKKIFISHSSKDAELAGALVDLFRDALNITAEDILCKSIDGYGLEGGNQINENLRRETVDAEVLVGLITAASIDSAYVLFELGARWGTGKKLIPLGGAR